MKDRIYDTKNGITKSIKSLEGLAALLSKRREAYFRNERLEVFVILGRYRLDNQGNIEKLKLPRKDALSNIPNVLTFEEFRRQAIGLGISYQDMVVAPGLHCPKCGLVWNINNLHEAMVFRTGEYVSLDDFNGKTLADVLDLHNKKNDGLYSFAPSEGAPDKDFIAKPGYSVRFSVVKLMHHDCKP
jgi:hypothetical protein